MIEIIIGILFGAISGAVLALLGYAKSSTLESFFPEKAVQTIIIGAVVGGIAGYYGWSYDQAYQWASSCGIVTIVEYAKKFIFRRLRLYTHAKESS